MNDTKTRDALRGPCGPLQLGGREEVSPDDELVVLAKAIAHPVRLRIVRLLGRQTTCVCGEIVDLLPLAQSTVSEHLRILKEAGLVRGEVDGPRVCYGLEPEGLARLKMLIGDL